MKRTIATLVVAAALAGGGIAHAQQGHHGNHGQQPAQMQHGGGHGAHAGHGSSAATKDTPATAAYRAANERMHKDMDIAFSGNPDVDFAMGMIPHHEGAVAMAKVVLEHGKDPELRKLAEEIVKAQATEIAFMRAWLKRNGQ